VPCPARLPRSRSEGNNSHLKGRPTPRVYYFLRTNAVEVSTAAKYQRALPPAEIQSDMSAAINP
jgi:hypothetical protein